MLWEMLNAARDLGRVHAIASVLSHYGFGGFVRSLGMGSRLDHYVNNIDNAISRLTMGIVTAALIIGSSIIMSVKGGPELFGLPAFGFLGYTFATVGASGYCFPFGEADNNTGILNQIRVVSRNPCSQHRNPKKPRQV